MTLNDIKTKLASSEYDFLRDNEHLGNHIILLGLGGSYSYGTNIETSDLDVRGIFLNTKNEILLGKDFGQYVSNETDTTIYSFNRIIHLLKNSNPNVIEILGLKPEHYLYLHPVAKELIDNRKLFLSKQIIHSFMGYAMQQLRRLENICARNISQEEHEKHILDTLDNAIYDIETRYDELDGSIDLYIDKSNKEELDSEIFVDCELKHYPLRDYSLIISEMNNIVRSYNKLGMRNSKAKEHGKISKHMMHTFRLYLMCLDILENEEINTYREKEHDLLMNIRNGKYINENEQPLPEFYDIVSEYEEKLEYAKEHTNLPDKPQYKKIDELLMSVNERIIKGEI